MRTAVRSSSRNGVDSVGDTCDRKSKEVASDNLKLSGKQLRHVFG
jgi:hypothetical protein